MSEEGKNLRQRLLVSLPLALTAVIAICTCISTYYSYQAAKIASEMKSIQSRQEIFGYIKEFMDMAAKYSHESDSGKKK